MFGKTKYLLSLIISVLLFILILFYFNNKYISSNSQLAQSGGSGPTTYYVSTSGDDANPGTIDQPWKTFDRAFANDPEHLRGGDTLYLRGGIYHVNEKTFTSAGDHLVTDIISGTSGQPTKISSYPGERASLYLSARVDNAWQKYNDRTDVNSIYYIDWATYVHDNYPWSYLYSGISNGLTTPTPKFLPQIVAIDGQVPTLLQEVNSTKNAWYPPDSVYNGQPPLPSIRTDQDDMIVGDFYYESDLSSPNHGKLFVWLPDNSEPNGKPLEISLTRWIYLGQQHDLVISDLDVRYGNVSSFAVNGSNIIFDNNNISYMGVFGLNGSSCSQCVVRNSTFFKNGNSGSSMIGNNIIYENNIFDSNNYRNYSPGWHAGNMKFIPGASDMIIRNNIIKNSFLAPGLWFDYMGSGQLIENNHFINNGVGYAKRGLMMEVTSGTIDKPNIIRNNIFDDNGLYISASQYNYVYNNSFYHGGVVIHGIEGTRTTVSNNQILNNIFYNFTGVPIFIVQDPPAPFVSTNNISDYNIFYSPNNTQIIFGGDFGWNSSLSLASWKAKGYDIHSLFIDPQLTDPVNGNFKPKTGSPVIDAGINTSRVTKDIDDNSRPQDGDGNGTATIDIGPYELDENVVIVPDTTPPVISGISASNITTTSATINWTTDEPVTSQVFYGRTTGYGSSTSPTSSNSQTLSGLQSNATYHYKISSTNSANLTVNSEDFTFSIPPIVNRAPIVNAGNNQTITLPSNAHLSPTVSDPDGQILSYLWSKVSGPSTATFGNALIANPTVTFGNSGTYTLRLAISDGFLTATDDINITVNPLVEVTTDSDGDNVPDTIDKCPNTPARLSAVVNTLGCPKPKVNSFTITNLDATDLRIVSTFEISNQSGKLTFASATTPYKLVRDSGSYQNQIDIDSNLQITNGKVNLNSLNLPELNRQATITFYNISLKNPKILKDGVECLPTICTNITYNTTAKTFIFTVLHFTNFSVVESASTDTTLPKLFFTSPHNNDSLTTGIIALSANATDSSGISGIRFIADGVYLGSFDTTFPYGAIWNATIGNHILEAIAKDLNNNYVIMTIRVTVKNASVTSAYNFGTVTLRNGSRGEAVKELQRFLNAKLNLGLVVDGKLGPKTIAVIKKWQKDNGLVADGLVGVKTKVKMNAMAR